MPFGSARPDAPGSVGRGVSTATARAAAACAVVAALCALGNLVTMALAVDFDVARLFAFGALVDVDARGARWLVASMFIDAGYYALLVPVAFALPARGAWGDLARISGVVYGTIGAGGALSLALLWPPLFDRFDAGDATAAAEFAALTDFIYQRIWNLVCAGAGAVWWVWVGATAQPRRWSLGARARRAAWRSAPPRRCSCPTARTPWRGTSATLALA